MVHQIRHEPYDLVEQFKKDMGKNIMTPHPISFLTKKNVVVEISKGRGMDNEDIFGVTVRKWNSQNGKWIDEDKSKMFYSKEEARKYAKQVVKE